MATNIKDKIAKLLALAESPNENEARAALLKARRRSRRPRRPRSSGTCWTSPARR